jgi:copper chaperone NosL
MMCAAAALLAGMFATPLWSIRLVAPQYPEGLGMQIRINTVVGITPTDLLNINGLNHYIGMKVIDPDSIPVLRAMPWVLGALVLGALLVALIGRRVALVGWLVTFGCAALAGLGEFWWWEYDYGHHIDVAHAIIKIPGMSYQPPVVGSKQLLNFTATSMPALGAYLALAAFVLALGALMLERRRTRAETAFRLEPSPTPIAHSEQPSLEAARI